MKKVGEKIVYRGNWLSVTEMDYRGEQGEEFTWEMVERIHDRGGMVIIARMKPSDRIILIRQYRPVLGNYIIGFPAGVAEAEDIEKEALRELLEETGYYGKVTQISPPLRSNPAMFADKVYIVEAEIIEEERNINPIQNLEPSEEIQVFLVEEKAIREFLLHQQEKGDEIGIGPWYAFATK
ncbi:MAG: NUDIX hydrolase [Bacillota bacterium]|nr:NUDIX hydrolase [Bacillota bacterium]